MKNVTPPPDRAQFWFEHVAKLGALTFEGIQQLTEVEYALLGFETPEEARAALGDATTRLLPREMRRPVVMRLASETNPETGKTWTQREIAHLLGVSHTTVDRDLGTNVPAEGAGHEGDEPVLGPNVPVEPITDEPESDKGAEPEPEAEKEDEPENIIDMTVDDETRAESLAQYIADLKHVAAATKNVVPPPQTDSAVKRYIHRNLVSALNETIDRLARESKGRRGTTP